MKIITNNVPRPVIYAGELSASERAQFDYLDWAAIDAGEESASFVRYRGRVYDLSEFEYAADPELSAWQGIALDSYFSGTVIRFCEDPEYVTLGTVYS